MVKNHGSSQDFPNNTNPMTISSATSAESQLSQLSHRTPKYSICFVTPYTYSNSSLSLGFKTPVAMSLDIAEFHLDPSFV